MADKNFHELLYIFVPLAVLALLVYFYSLHRKKIRVRLLRQLKFKVMTKINRGTRFTLCKLAPEIMTSCKTGFGTVIIGKDPSVWWLATSKKEQDELYIFKISKTHERYTNDYILKEWIVIVLKSNQSQQIDKRKLLSLVPTPDDYEYPDNSICLIYRDLFLSMGKLKKIISGIHQYRSIKQC
jgi:hypothetical protein